VVIIGGGPAGYTAAIRAAQYGLKVALIEKTDKLGGTCLHVGCIPTKALLFNAEIWDHLKHASDYGIDGIGTPKLNWAAVQQRKDAIVTKHTKGLDFLMKKNKVTRHRGLRQPHWLRQGRRAHRRGVHHRRYRDPGARPRISSWPPALKPKCSPASPPTIASSPTSKSLPS
jgi:succinate dehydrogenase/fumarate reductase flavoprotein subunit